MSSCPPTRSGRRRRGVAGAALVVLAALLGTIGVPAAAAPAPLVVVPATVVDGRMRMVVVVPDGAGPVAPDEVTVDGTPVPGATVQPVLAGRPALALVVDASADGAALLPVGLGGAANLVLTAPAATRGTVVADTTPPAVAVPWPSGQAVVLRGLSAVEAGGARSTAAALDLAAAQLGPAGDDPRLVVLYTGAPDAGGEPPAAVAERLRAAGVLLAVVCPSAGPPDDPAEPAFWADAAAGTGGPAVRAGPAEVIAAFDRVAAELGRRYVVTAPVPERLPATVAVRVGALTGTAVVAPPVAGGVDDGVVNGGPVVLILVAVLVVLAAVALVVVARRRRSRRDAPDPPPAAAPPPPRRVWSIPPPLAGAAERDDLEAELEMALKDGRPVWVRPHPDVPGLGVSTLLAGFAHRHRDRYDVAWWIPAMDPDLVADRLAELAEVLGVAGPDDPADRAAARLVEALGRRDRWLLVFDDAGGPRQLAGYLPDGPGHVLVSSSHAGWGDLAGPVAVRAFRRAESAAVLTARRPDLGAGPVDGLAAALGDLPLAVGPAAAFLADTGLSVGALRSLLPAGAEGPDPVWAAMLDRIGDDPQALALLTLVGWLGPAPVPLSLLTENSEALPEPLGTVARLPAGLRERAALLGRRGLVQVADDEVALHPVPAALVVARTADDRPDDGGWTAVAVRLLRAAAPDGPATDPAVRSAWRRLLPHVLAATDPARRLDPVAAEVGWLLRAAGEYLQARGRTHAAQALLDDARGYGTAGPIA